MSSVESDVVSAAARAVDAMQERAGGRLDFSASSLDAIEELLSEASAFVATMPAKTVDALVQQVGCYVLEVGRRQFGGVYYWNEDQSQPILVVGEPVAHIAIMSWNKVRGRLGGDIGDNIPFFYRGFAERAVKPSSGSRVLFV